MNSDGLIWLQISAGQGPAECAWVVARLVEVLTHAAKAEALDCELIEAESGDVPQTLKSALMGLRGPAAEAFARHWQGTVQWIGRSPFRPKHRRKNWFVGIEGFVPPAASSWNPAEIACETQRSGGPGGQHVNKVETAVRVTHLPSGLSVLATQERSQWRNRQLGLARLQALLQDRQNQALFQARNERWQAHHHLERGNPVRVFTGPEFKLSD
jgi:peptide chain release factor